MTKRGSTEEKVRGRGAQGEGGRGWGHGLGSCATSIMGHLPSIGIAEIVGVYKGGWARLLESTNARGMTVAAMFGE